MFVRLNCPKTTKTWSKTVKQKEKLKIRIPIEIFGKLIQGDNSKSVTICDYCSD